jgi:hypothetical protein
MARIIDTNNETTHALQQLKNAGVECVIRYISTNTSSEKVVKPAEARAIADAGLKLALVFEVWGGANNFVHGDIHAQNGAKHGEFARQWAASVGAPDNIIIWFAIDTDCSTSHYDVRVKPYLVAARAALQGKYRIGVYACGFVCGRALDEDIVDATWLTQSMGWNGSRTYRDSRRWRLLQGPESTLGGLSIDTNEANGDDYGAFVPFHSPVSVPALAAPTMHASGMPMSAPDLLRIWQSIGQLVGILSTFVLPLLRLIPGPVGATAAILSPIDKLLGGTALVGLKTPIAIFGYGVLWILQALDRVGTASGETATTTGSVLTALFAGLGTAGVAAKFDRALQALSRIAGSLQKLPRLPMPTPKSGGS